MKCTLHLINRNFNVTLGFNQLLRVDLETSIKSVTNKITNTKLTEILDFNSIINKINTIASNTKVFWVGGAVIHV